MRSQRMAALTARRSTPGGRLLPALAAEDAPPRELGVGAELFLDAQQLVVLREAVGERLPAVPVVLVHAVLDRDDRVALGRAGPVVGQLGGAERAALVLEDVGAPRVDLAGRGVERDRDVLRAGSRRPRCPARAAG